MIKKITKFFFALVFVLSSNSLSAQIISINDPADTESTQSLQKLIENVLISGDCADVEFESNPVDGYQVFGADIDNQTKSYGYFKKPVGSRFPFEEGVVLTTGNAFQAGNTIGPATGIPHPSNGNGLGGDVDLESALGIPNTNDATWIKFKFRPFSSDISFRFIMASEEYDGNTECNFADGFAFLLREEGTTTYTNLAVLPDGNTPVSVTNINSAGACASNQTFFDGYDLGDTNYGGQTVVLTANSPVTPGVQYEIKLVVADAVDSIWDSAIFLEAGSFVLSADIGDSQVAADNNAVCGPTKLLDAGAGAQSFQWFFDDGSGFNPISGAINQTYNASLGNGTYKVEATFAAGCVAEDEIYLEFVDLAIATKPSDMIFCDDDNDGSMIFNLKNQDTDILNGQSSSDFEVLYFRDALYTDEITGANITTFTSTGQTIYSRVRNLNSTNCDADTDFDLIVYESAFPLITGNITILGHCDNTSVGSDIDGFIVFNLHDRKTEILNGQSAAGFTLTYFLDAAYTTQIPVADETNFTNTIAGGQPIYVRMTNDLTSTFTTPCSTDTSFELEVFELPVLNTPPFVLEQCDDDFDGFNSFNLSEINTDIITTITTEVFTYYESLVAAEAGILGTEILNPTTYTNEIINTDTTIWARAENANGCYRTSQFTLVVKPSAIPPAFLRTFEECDEGTDDTDGITIFNFSSVTAEVQALFPTAVDVFYYRNQADATAEVNEITDPSNYENIGYPNTQEVWVRADSQLGNDCLGNGHHVTLVVNPIPNIDTTLTLAPLCDDDTGIAMDDTNGFGVEFDLESLTNNIENLQPDFPTVPYNVTYHLSDAEALSGVNPQSSPFRNTANNQIIYVRVVNTDTTCINPHMTFTLDVTPLPIVNFTGISLASQCDNTVDGDDTNGTGVTFDLGSLRSDFENLQPDFPAVNYTVTYHETIADAQALPALNPLPDLYPNTANNQTIFVRIENDDTGCIRIEESPIFLVVDPLPIISAITVDPRCDDDLDGDDMNEVVTWVLDDYVSDYNDMQTVTTATYDVTFHTAIPTTTANQITTTGAYPNNSNSEEIFVRVTNTDTTCFREILGFELVVNSLPDFELMTDDIVCENILPHYIAVENPLENDYNYEWFNASGTSIGNNQILEITDTNDLTITGVDYTVKVTNPTTFCERSKIINLKKSSIATLTDDDIVSVEFSSPANSIEIITTNLGSGNYEYALDHPYDSRPYQDEPIFEGLLGGIYTLKINDKNECGEFSKDIALIDYPKFLTPNNDGYNDLWQLIGLDTAAFTISPIQIYDRFGKIVAIVNPIQGEGWDGLYNNEMLPSSDYWFSLELTDNQGNIKRHRGHFSLVRR